MSKKQDKKRKGFAIVIVTTIMYLYAVEVGFEVMDWWNGQASAKSAAICVLTLYGMHKIIKYAKQHG